jgi:hypothetical protein
VDLRRAKDTFFLEIIRCKSFTHHLYFFAGSAIVKFLVLTSQPWIVKFSDKLPSSMSLLSDRQSSLDNGSFWSKGLHKTCIAKSIDWIARNIFWCRSGVIAIPSSINILTFPSSSGSNSISKGMASANGIESSSSDGFDNFDE